ncbi:MAG: BON domain-containing protein [Chloroflexi bacterium]|nr:BON domain-containing protein [Chloroflexota bacterium]
MSESQTVQARPDIDIDSDLHELVKAYPPLQADRHHLHISVSNGQVQVSGHVKSPMTRRFVETRFGSVAGVKNVQLDGLYDDETLRLAAGKLVPPGALVTSDYGTLVLAGVVEAGAREALIKQLEGIAGVKRVVAGFRD